MSLKNEFLKRSFSFVWHFISQICSHVCSEMWDVIESLVATVKT